MPKQSRICLRTLATLSLLSLSVACSPVSRATQDVFGPDQRSGLLIYFKVDATNPQINDFLANVIGKPGKGPGGIEFLPGMAGLNALQSVQGHAGYSVDFLATATQDERNVVKTRAQASPIVFKILENAIPSQITSLDQR